MRTMSRVEPSNLPVKKITLIDYKKKFFSKKI